MGYNKVALPDSEGQTEHISNAEFRPLSFDSVCQAYNGSKIFLSGYNYEISFVKTFGQKSQAQVQNPKSKFNFDFFCLFVF